MRGDDTIVAQVHARLADDPRLPHPGEVAVSEQGGTVTLRGSVASPRQRHAAVEAAKSVPGVQRVVDQLDLDPRDHWEDGELRGAALRALLATGDIPMDRIEV